WGADFAAKWPLRQAARFIRAASCAGKERPPNSATSTQNCTTGAIATLFRLLDDFLNAPALLLGHRARFDDAHQVAHAGLVLLVVDLEACALPHRLAVEAVGLARADLDDDGLVHLVGDDRAEAELAATAGLSLGLGLRRRRGGVAHSDSSFLARRPR